MEQINNDVIHFLLILFRISGIFMFTPIFSNRAVKRRVRLGFCFFLTVLLFNLVPKSDSIFQNLNFPYLTILLLKEVLIGALMGYFVLLMFTVVQTASQIYSINMGLVMASVFDPISQLQIPVLGQVKYLFLTGLFFCLWCS
jgi:flagellar biosynthetic protein FliR